MAEPAARFKPTQAQWADAQEEADKRAPLPRTSAPFVVVVGFFGAFTVTYFLLMISEIFGLAGLDSDEPTFEMPAILAGAVCSLCGFSYVRSKEKAHYDVFRRVLNAYEANEPVPK